MEHRHDHPGNRPPGPHPSEEIPPSEVLAQRRAFLEISDADVERVRGLAGLFDSFLDGYVEQFFAHLVAHPVTASFLTDADLVARLKQAQKRYFESLLRARLDADYVVDRQRIGQVHADVGLEPPWFLGAYNQYLQYTFRQFAAHCGGDLGCYVEGTLALLKLLLLDMGLALDPYFARSTEHLRTALRLLAQSNVELKEFAHLASHDLKTPLATVANLCEEFLDEFGPQVPAEGRGLIEAARSKTLKLGRMIDELLEISEAGRRRRTSASPSRRGHSWIKCWSGFARRSKGDRSRSRCRTTCPKCTPTPVGFARSSTTCCPTRSNSWTRRPVRSGSASKLQTASTSSASVTTDPASRRLTCRRSSPRSGACPSIGTSPDQAWVCTS